MSPTPTDRDGYQRRTPSRTDDSITPAIHPTLVAVDLGAESCRVSLLRWLNGHPEIILVHRFSNRPIDENDTLRWDLKHICQGIEAGLRACAELVPAGISAIGIDGCS